MKFKDKQKLLNGALLKRITTLEEKSCKLYVGNEASRGSFASLFPRVEKLEKMPALIDDHIKRLADHDESIEALSETVDQLSTCKCEAGADMLRRINNLEAYREHIGNLNLNNRVTDLEETNRVFLKSIPDIEILKVQVQGLEDDRKAIFPHTHTPIDDKIDFVANQVKVLVRDVDTLKIQMHNLLPVHNNMMTEVLKQKAFLEKVQKILDRERDARIKKSPGYKAEIAAMKTDKEADMMIKKGRPRKP